MTQGWLYTGFVVDGHIYASFFKNNRSGDLHSKVEPICFILGWGEGVLPNYLYWSFLRNNRSGGLYSEISPEFSFICFAPFWGWVGWCVFSVEGFVFWWCLRGSCQNWQLYWSILSCSLIWHPFHDNCASSCLFILHRKKLKRELNHFKQQAKIYYHKYYSITDPSKLASSSSAIKDSKATQPPPPASETIATKDSKAPHKPAPDTIDPMQRTLKSKITTSVEFIPSFF